MACSFVSDVSLRRPYQSASQYSHGGQVGRRRAQSHNDMCLFLPVPQRPYHRVPLLISSQRGKVAPVPLAHPALTFPRVIAIRKLDEKEAGAGHGDVSSTAAAVRTIRLVLSRHTLRVKVAGKVLPVLCPVGYGAVPLSGRQPLWRGRVCLVERFFKMQLLMECTAKLK